MSLACPPIVPQMSPDLSRAMSHECHKDVTNMSRRCHKKVTQDVTTGGQGKMKTPHRYDEGAAGILKQSPLLFEALSKLFRASIGAQSEFVGENASLSSLNRREPFTVLSPFFHRYFTADPISRRSLGVHLISQPLHWWEALSRFFLASRPHNGRMRGFVAASLPHFACSFCCSLVMVTQKGG